MPLPLSAEMLAHCYEYLACQKPFSGWNLPPAEDIKFGVISHRDRFAHHRMCAGQHFIEVSRHLIGRHDVLISTMAHEMIHVYAEITGMGAGNPHGKVFHKLADRVCRLHEFDRAVF